MTARPFYGRSLWLLAIGLLVISSAAAEVAVAEDRISGICVDLWGQQWALGWAHLLGATAFLVVFYAGLLFSTILILRALILRGILDFGIQSPLEMLQTRYAMGLISEDEYQHKFEVLAR